MLKIARGEGEEGEWEEGFLDPEILTPSIFLGKANPFLEPEENCSRSGEAGRERAGSGYCLEIGIGTQPLVEIGSLTSSKHPAPAGLGHRNSSLIPYI